MNRKTINQKYDSMSNSNYINDTLTNEIYQENIYREQLKSQLELNENIIRERNEKIEELFKDVIIINDIFKDLNKLVVEQSEPIAKIELQIDETIQKTHDRVENLKKAEKYHKSWLSQKNKLILMGIAGLTINVPITLTLGLKAGAISGLSTIGLSAITSLFSK